MPTNDNALAKRDFLRLFKDGFEDQLYLLRERNYKVRAHEIWCDQLGESSYRDLIVSERYDVIAQRLLRVNSGLNLLGRFEIIALRDALKTPIGAKLIGTAVFESVYGSLSPEAGFVQLSNAFARAPLKRGRVTTWPVQTLFPFLARPEEHLFLKPNATRTAAERFGFELQYNSQPNWLTYSRLVQFGRELRSDLQALKPKDFIDIQSFIWVSTSSGYAKELI
jgi:hypothetical protein